MKCKSSFNVNHICVYCDSAVVIYEQNLLNLMSRSTLHKGDMSSNVFENFTTYEKNHISLQSEIKSFSKLKTKKVIMTFSYTLKIKQQMNLWGNGKRKVSQVSQCPPEEAQSNVHTAAESALAAWSSWQSFPGRSVPQTGHWPPPAKPVAATINTVTSFVLYTNIFPHSW